MRKAKLPRSRSFLAQGDGPVQVSAHTYRVAATSYGELDNGDIILEGAFGSLSDIRVPVKVDHMFGTVAGFASDFELSGDTIYATMSFPDDMQSALDVRAAIQHELSSGVSIGVAATEDSDWEWNDNGGITIDHGEIYELSVLMGPRPANSVAGPDSFTRLNSMEGNILMDEDQVTEHDEEEEDEEEETSADETSESEEHDDDTEEEASHSDDTPDSKSHAKDDTDEHGGGDRRRRRRRKRSQTRTAPPVISHALETASLGQHSLTPDPSVRVIATHMRELQHEAELRTHAIAAQGVAAGGSQGRSWIAVAATSGDPWMAFAEQRTPSTGMVSGLSFAEPAFAKVASATNPTYNSNGPADNTQTLEYAQTNYRTSMPQVEDVPEFRSAVDTAIRNSWSTHRGTETHAVIDSASGVLETNTGVAAGLPTTTLALLNALSAMRNQVYDQIEMGSSAYIVHLDILTALEAGSVDGLVYDPTMMVNRLHGFPLIGWSGFAAVAANGIAAYFGSWRRALLQAERPSLVVQAMNQTVPGSLIHHAHGRFKAIAKQPTAIARLKIAT